MRAIRCLSFVVALTVAASIPSPGTAFGSMGWPQDGYDSGHSNANSEEWRLRPGSVGRLRLLWSRSVRPPGVTPDAFLFENLQLPVVRVEAFASWWGQEVDAPMLVALDPGTGRVRWVRSSEWVVAAASADTAFVNGPHRLVAVDTRSGARRWARSGTQVIAAAPAVDRLVVRLPNGLGVIEASDGRQVWVRTDLEIGSGVMAGGVIVVSVTRPGHDALVGLAAKTGDTVWRRIAWWPGAGWTVPEAAAGGLVYVVSRARSAEGRGTVRAMRLDDGAMVWRRELRDGSVGVAAVGGGRLFLTRSRCATPDGCDPGADYWPEKGALLALGARSGRTLWRLPGEDETARPLWRVGALANGLLYASGIRRMFSFDDLRAGLAVITAATGRIRWSSSIRGSFARVAAVADGRVFVTAWQGDRGGRVLAYGLGPSRPFIREDR
jgi:outer membrane protein assembly factor BamB